MALTSDYSYHVTVAPGGAMEVEGETAPLVLEHYAIEGHGEGLAINLGPLARTILEQLGRTLIKSSKITFKTGISIIVLATNSVLNLALYTSKSVGFTIIGTRVIGSIGQPLNALNVKLSQYAFTSLNNWAENIQRDNNRIIQLAKHSFGAKGCQLRLSGHAYKDLAYESFKAFMVPVAMLSNIVHGLFWFVSKALYPVCCLGACIDGECLRPGGGYRENYKFTVEYLPELAPFAKALHNSISSCFDRQYVD